MLLESARLGMLVGLFTENEIDGANLAGDFVRATLAHPDISQGWGPATQNDPLLA